MGNINISKNSGTGNSSFTISAKAQNNTVNDIVSTVKVTNADGREALVTFTQKGRNKATAISSSDITILNGQSANIDVVVVPSDALCNFTYEVVSGNNVVSVSNDGEVTGTGIGSAEIKVTDTVSGKTATIHVTVNANGYTVVKNAQGCTIQGADSATEASTYTASINPTLGYDMPAANKVTVTMNGVTLTSSQYTYNATTGAISIPNVSGNIVISAEASQHEFSVTPLSIEASWNDLAAKTVTVKSNIGWTIAEQ